MKTKLTKHEENRATAIAIKTMRGELLTKEEFDLAIKKEFFQTNLKFQDFCLLYYEDDKKFGYISLDKKDLERRGEDAKQLKEMKEGKRKSVSLRMTFGVSPRDMKMKFLTPLQKVVLKHYGLLKYVKGGEGK